MFKKFSFLFLLAACCICLSTGTASADIVFNDLPSTGNQYDNSSGLSAYGSGYILGPIASAAQFTTNGLTGSFNVTTIDVAVDKQPVAGNDGIFQVQIWQSSSNAPGTLVYTSPDLTATYDYKSPVHSLLTISGITTLSLTAGTQYFMSVDVVDHTNGDVAWYRNSLSPLLTGLVLVSNDHGGSWHASGTNEMPAFDILGTPTSPVPIPSAMLLLGPGLIGLAAIRRRFKK